MSGADDHDEGPTHPVHHDREGHRFVLRADGQVAELTYHREGDRLVLDHTGVPDPVQHRGYAGRLVAAALDLARRDGLTVVPHCSYARRWLDSHPDEAATVSVARS